MTTPVVKYPCQYCVGHGGWTVNPKHPIEEHTYECDVCDGTGWVDFALVDAAAVHEAVWALGPEIVRDAYRAAGFTDAEATIEIADWIEKPQEVGNG